MTGIVFLLNVTYAPYIHKYIDILRDAEEEFEVIYWDRMNKPDHLEEWKTHVFDHQSNLAKNKFLKVKDFFAFRSFVKNIINQKKYDKLIILTTLTGVMLSDLLKKYEGKFILDIRDYTFERIPFFKKIEKKIIDKSAFTVISSSGFKNFLPPSENYVISHNFSYSDLEAVKREQQVETYKQSPLNLGFIGSIRHFNLDSQIIKIFNRDKRFQLTYHGDGPSYNKLKEFCVTNNYKDGFTGRFTRSEKADLLNDIDIINAYYSEKKYANMYAISNKYYDALIYKKPILVNSNVHIGKIVSQNKVGFAVDINKSDVTNKIYNDYLKFDFKEFYDRCDEVLQKVLKEDREYCDQVFDFVKRT